MDELNSELDTILAEKNDTQYLLNGHFFAISLLLVATYGLLIVNSCKSSKDVQTVASNDVKSSYFQKSSPKNNCMNSQNTTRFSSQYFVVNPEFSPSQKSSSIFNYDTINSKVE